MQASDALKEMKSFREKLPAFKMKSEFLKAVSKNQVGRAIFIMTKMSYLSSVIGLMLIGL